MQPAVALLLPQGQPFYGLQLAVVDGFLPRKTKLLLANSLFPNHAITPGLSLKESLDKRIQEKQRLWGTTLTSK